MCVQLTYMLPQCMHSADHCSSQASVHNISGAELCCRVSEGAVNQQRRYPKGLGRQAGHAAAGFREALQQHRALGSALQGCVGPRQRYNHLRQHETHGVPLFFFLLSLFCQTFIVTFLKSFHEEPSRCFCTGATLTTHVQGRCLKDCVAAA